jgi:hypothetical protein
VTITHKYISTKPVFKKWEEGIDWRPEFKWSMYLFRVREYACI